MLTIFHRRTRPLAAVTLALALVASSCTAAEDTTTVTTAETTEAPAETTVTSADTAEAPTVTSAQTPARQQLDNIVELLNREQPPTAADFSARFSPEFLAQVPAEQMVATLPQILALAEPPFTVERFEPLPDGVSAEAVLLGADGNRLSTQIAVNASEPNLIEGIQFLPFDLEFPTPIDVDSLDSRLAEMAPQSSLGVYDISNGACEPIHEIRTETPVVLGSIFKLWVLAALAHQIDEGQAKWDETVKVIDELRSSPVGDIYQMDTGTEVTLQELAEAMISISDNTATDLLIDRLGRQAVETAQVQAGVADPQANIPMLSTGNLFSLKFVAEPPNTVDYQALDEAGKRSLLEELDGAVLPWVGSESSLQDLATTTNANGVPLDQPRDLDLEWFATTTDLCRTMIHLRELAGIPGLEPVASILQINPGEGIPFDRDRWPTIGFKGGSEPGVIAGAWWLEGPQGDAYVVAGGLANPDAAISELDAILILASASELIE